MPVMLNDPCLPTIIQKNGGKFRCLLGIAEKTGGQNLSKDKIMKIYHIAVNIPDVMNAQCRCFSEDHRIIRMGFLSMQDKKAFARQVGYVSYHENIPNVFEEGTESLNSAFMETEFDFIIKEWLAEDGRIYATLFDKKEQKISSFWNENISKEPQFADWQNCSYYKVFYNI